MKAFREYGRAGGKIGGKRRAKKLSARRRSEIARLGAKATNRARWGKPKKRGSK